MSCNKNTISLFLITLMMEGTQDLIEGTLWIKNYQLLKFHPILHDAGCDSIENLLPVRVMHSDAT